MNAPCGVTLGWDGKPALAFQGKRGLEVLFGGHSTDLRFYPEYFPGGTDWPVDPITGDKLPIALSTSKKVRRNKPSFWLFLCRFGIHKERLAKDIRLGYGGITGEFFCLRCGKTTNPATVWPRPPEVI